MKDLTTAEVIELIGKEESATLEFKATVRDPRLLSQLIGSFANASGGTIVVGVQVPGQIVGVDESHFRKLFDTAVRLTMPSGLAKLSFHEIESKKVAAIQVSGSGLVVLSEGTPFVRAGTRTQPMAWRQITEKIPEKKAAEAVEALAKAIEKQSNIIEELREEIKAANSWKSKWVDYVVSGLVGAVIGAVVTATMG